MYCNGSYTRIFNKSCVDMNKVNFYKNAIIIINDNQEMPKIIALLYVFYFVVLSTALEYSRDSSQLTCTSSGGLVTSVRWSVDNADITNDSPLFSQTITLVDRLTATYHLVLSGDISNFMGTFSCGVIDGDMRSSSASHETNGINLCYLSLLVLVFMYPALLITT